MKLVLLSCSVVFCFVAGAAIDRPDVLTFRETGYHQGGWFDYRIDVHSGGDGILIDKSDAFLLSPLYPAPIRKIALRVYCSSANPTRQLRIRPLVDGIEVGTNVFNCVVSSVRAEKTYEFVTFDFSASDDVTAFRLGAEGGSGNWRVAMICVAYGTKDAGEDAVFKEFAYELPVPENLLVTDFTKSSFDLAADEVEDAAGYRFRVERLEGVPRTELREDFSTTAGELSPGWQIAKDQNATFGVYTGNGYYDSSAGNKCAMKIERKSESGAPVEVEIDSPICGAPVSQCSFFCRVGSTNSTDVFKVYGRKGDSTEWTELHAFVPSSNARTNQSFSVATTANLVQVRFSVKAESAKSFSSAALDSLCVIYGGDESRTVVEDGTMVLSEPSYSTNGLATARYECRIQAVGSNYRDSSWSSPLLLDLNWADLTVTAPTGVVTSAAGGKLTVSWEPVAGADCYLVDVVSVDDPDTFAVRAQKTSSAFLTVAVPFIGDYAVTVTAVAPGGRARATSAETVGSVVLDQLGAVTAEALDRQTIAATWKAIPLAESYLATLVKVIGSAETLDYGWQAEDGSLVLPEGWTCEKSWDHDVWKSGESSYPRLPYTACYIESPVYERPITKFVCRYKCGVTAAATLDATRLKIEISDDTGVWTELAKLATTTKLGEFSQSFAATRNIRRIRLTSDSATIKTMGKVDIGKLSLTLGEETNETVESLVVTKGTAEFRGLDPEGRYRVVVAPQPSDGADSASAAIDLANEIFRATGAVSVNRSRRDLRYEETFASLTNQASDTVVRRAGLDYWQFYRGAVEAEKLLYTAGTNRTTGGVYAFGAADGSRQLGTLATSAVGCSIGIAFRNDGCKPVHLTSLSFTSVQRSFRTKPSTYALEWLMTGGETRIGAEGEWTAIEIPEIAPRTAETQEGLSELRQDIAVTNGLPQDPLPPGGVLILRWRHDKVASGPMMALAGVSAEFSRPKSGTVLLLR